MLARSWMFSVVLLLGLGPASKPSAEWKLRDGAIPILQTVIDRQEELRPSQVARLEREIKAATAAASSNQNLPRISREELARLRRLLTDTKARHVIALDGPMTSPTKITVGWAGPGLERHVKCVVSQVIDESQAIADMVYQVQVGDIRRPQMEERRLSFWISDVPTAGWTDGMKISLPELLVATGTHQYETAAGGVRTVMELRPFKYDDFIRVKK